jgi:hypothetical protein
MWDLRPGRGIRLPNWKDGIMVDGSDADRFKRMRDKCKPDKFIDDIVKFLESDGFDIEQWELDNTDGK